MANLAIDALDTTINPAAIRQAGYVAVLNYLRNVTSQVVAGYHAAGLGFASIFETLADESLRGAPAGTWDGQVAAAQMGALGQPPGTLHTVNLADFAPTPDQLPAIEAYWNAYRAATSDWHVIPYATGWVLQTMNVAGWQNAMDNNGVPGSIVVPQAVMYQRISPTLPRFPGDYDEDVLLADLPWWGPVPASSSSSIHLPTTKDEPMFVGYDTTSQFLILATGKVPVLTPADGSALTDPPPKGAGLPYAQLSTAQLAAIPNAT